MQNKVLLIIAQKGFQSKEYFDTKDVLQNEGIHVVTTAPLHEMAYSHMGDEVMPDLALSDGAICIAPRILAKAGVLKNVHATGWDGDGELQRVFDTYGVIRVEESVVMDGVVVTAHGPAAARDFGKKIIEVLRKK